MIDRPEQATTAIAATELARAAGLLDLLDGFLCTGNGVAGLLDLLDGFLRTGNGVADSLHDYLDTTTADHPHRPGYDAHLVIDLVGLTAHALRNHTHPLQ